MATKKWQRRKFSHGFKMAGGEKVFVPCDDATETIELLVSRKYFILGRPGEECACAITEFGLAHAHLYPHKVYWMETGRTCQWVVDKLDSKGRWKHCLKYRHNKTNEIDEFDAPGGKQRLLRQPDLEWEVTLKPPVKRKPQTKSGVPEGDYSGDRIKIVGEGPSFSKDRWMRAMRRSQAMRVAATETK